MKTFGFLTLFLLFSICYSKKLTAQILVDSSRVIFPKHFVVHVDLNKDSIFRRFTPSIQEISQADSLILQYVIDKKPDAVPYFIKTIYYRQYVGLFTVNGKVLYVNAHCQKPEYFLKNTYYPKGGGKCFYQSLILLYPNKIEDFGFNAPK